MERTHIFNDLIDLHVHLGSSSTPHFLWEAAHEQGIKLPEKNYNKFIKSALVTKNLSYDRYLNYFHLSELIQSSLWAVEKAVHHAISLSYRKANVTLLEIRFNPMLRNRNNQHDLDKIILAAAIGMKKACLEYPVKAGLILMMDRRFDPKKNLMIAKKAVQLRNDGVIGLDTGGPIHEDFKVSDVVDAYNLVKEYGLKTTFHTGEVTSSQEVLDVINLINPDRIGHGIRSVDDPKVLKLLADKQIVLELCPTSNFRTSVVKDWQEFKKIIDVFRAYKIPFTINSDGPAFLQTNVKKELHSLYQRDILSAEEIENIKKLSRKVSFIRGEQKEWQYA
ncbi:MAG: adenosine deaminase [Rickettsiales bacterium]|nr:adenosine deaminase [Rickettsiales bacterium]